MRLTKSVVAALELSGGKTDHIEWDDALPGFGVRLRAGKETKRTYVVQYRSGRRQRRQILGDVRTVELEAARRVARRRLGAVALGQDPAGERAEARRRAALTLGSFVPRFLERKRAQLRPRSFNAVERHLVRHWAPFHERPVHEIARRDVAALLTEIESKHGPGPAREARYVLNELFAWLMGEGVVDANPVIGTNAPPQAKARERVLSDAELVAIWRAAGNTGEYSTIVRLLTVLPCRREEIADLRWDELDLNRGMLRIPGSRTKNGHPFDLPLPPIALELLAEVTSCRLHDRRVFGKGRMGFANWSEGKLALDKRLGGALPHWTHHDLRRTAATRMGDLGVQPHVIEAVLNHHSGHKRGVAGVYNRSPYEREVKAAMLLWGEHVRSVVEDSGRKVVPLQIRR
jgi:integrase